MTTTTRHDLGALAELAQRWEADAAQRSRVAEDYDADAARYNDNAAAVNHATNMAEQYRAQARTFTSCARNLADLLADLDGLAAAVLDAVPALDAQAAAILARWSTAYDVAETTATPSPSAHDLVTYAAELLSVTLDADDLDALADRVFDQLCNSEELHEVAHTVADELRRHARTGR